MKTITESTNKAEIISADCEAIDDQQAKIKQLKTESYVLWAVVSFLVVLLTF